MFPSFLMCTPTGLVSFQVWYTKIMNQGTQTTKQRSMPAVLYMLSILCFVSTEYYVDRVLDAGGVYDREIVLWLHSISIALFILSIISRWFYIRLAATDTGKTPAIVRVQNQEKRHWLKTTAVVALYTITAIIFYGLMSPIFFPSLYT